MVSNRSYARIVSRGFSLVELSVVLVVIAVLLGSSMSVMNTRNDTTKRRQTVAKMEAIEQALVAHLTLRGRLPCPTYNNIDFTSSDAGKEYCYATSTKDMSGSLPSGFSSSYTDNLILVGGIPTRTLNLPDEYMLDGWGKRMDYAVTAAFAGYQGGYNAPSTSYRFRNTNKGIITVQDSTGAVRTAEAAFVLISHGINGWGARTSTGGITTAPVNANELKNYYATGTVAGTMAFVQQEFMPSTSIVFDDIVRYKMKWQLIKEAGMQFSTTVCTTAEVILNTPDVSISSAYYSAYCGATPGDANCQTYITSLATLVRNRCL